MSTEPTFHRCPHDPDHPFSMISNALIRDKNLSPQARWLMIYLLSNKDGFHVTMTVIRETQNIGRDALQNYFKECEKAGYIKRVVSKSENNLLKTKFHFSETPKFKENSPNTGFQAPGFQLPEGCVAKEDYVKNTNVCNVCKEEPASVLFCVKKDTQGNELRIEKDSIFKEAIRTKTGITTQEINEAWEVLCAYSKPVSDGFKFIKATIENHRVQKQNQEIAKKYKAKKEEKCQKINSTNSKQESDNSKSTTTESAMSMPQWHEFLRSQGLKVPPSKNI